MDATMTDRTTYAVLHHALSYLARHDEDYASTQNSIGFSRFDGTQGHRLAETPFDFWTDNDVAIAYRIARRYRNTQLSHYDLELPAPPAPDERRGNPLRSPRTYRNDSPAAAANRPQREPGYASMELNDTGNAVICRWGGDDPQFHTRKDRVKALGGRWNPDDKTWTVAANLTTVDGLVDLVADSLEWTVPFEATEDLANRFATMAGQWQESLAASAAKDQDITVTGLTPGKELRPFQKAGVAYALQHKRTLIADEMGLGKTIQAIAAIVATEAYPSLIICPSSLKRNWEKEIRAWVPGATVQQISGTKGGEIDPTAQWVIGNYDIIHGWQPAITAMHWGAMVCDESHACKNSKTRRTKAVRGIAKSTKPDLVMLLSGTPILNRPIELWSQLEILGRDVDFNGFWKFVYRYCDAESNGFGYDFSGSSNLDELNTRLRSSGAMVRRTKDDVLTELPPKQWSTVPLAISAKDSKAYRIAESDIAAWSAAQKTEDAERLESWHHEATQQGLEGPAIGEFLIAKRKVWQQSEEFRLRQSEQLIRFEALKQLAYAAKREQMFAWIDEFLESGKKLVVFGWHVEVVKEIAAKYNAPTIMGGQDRDAIEAGKERFQTDPECRVIVCNIKAGGVGHTLTAASDVAFVEFGWNPSDMDQAADRCHRIGQTDSVTAWQLVAEHDDGGTTIEGELVDLIASKRNVVTTATDGLGIAQQSGMLTELMDRIKRRTGKEDESYEADRADAFDIKFGV
jgi:hypothetical protein